MSIILRCVPAHHRSTQPLLTTSSLNRIRDSVGQVYRRCWRRVAHHLTLPQCIRPRRDVLRVMGKCISAVLTRWFEIPMEPTHSSNPQGSFPFDGARMCITLDAQKSSVESKCQGQSNASINIEPTSREGLPQPQRSRKCTSGGDLKGANKISYIQ